MGTGSEGASGRSLDGASVGIGRPVLFFFQRLQRNFNRSAVYPQYAVFNLPAALWSMDFALHRFRVDHPDVGDAELEHLADFLIHADGSIPRRQNLDPDEWRAAEYLLVRRRPEEDTDIGQHILSLANSMPLVAEYFYVPELFPPDEVRAKDDLKSTMPFLAHIPLDQHAIFVFAVRLICRAQVFFFGNKSCRL